MPPPDNEIWIHAELTGIAPRGINYWESKDRKDRRLIFQRNSYLEEIDARTGKSILTFGTDGIVNLRDGLRRFPAANPFGRMQSNNPGKIFENLIILGSAPGEGFLSPRGRSARLRRHHRQAGLAVPHRSRAPASTATTPMPKDGWSYVGANNTWGEITVDEKRGIAYFPTGSPTYRFLRRRPHRRQPVRRLPAGPRRPHRQAPLAFPDGPSRPVGFRQHVARRN